MNNTITRSRQKWIHGITPFYSICYNGTLFFYMEIGIMPLFESLYCDYYRQNHHHLIVSNYFHFATYGRVVSILRIRHANKFVHENARSQLSQRHVEPWLLRNRIILAFRYCQVNSDLSIRYWPGEAVGCKVRGTCACVIIIETQFGETNYCRFRI